MAIVGGGGRPSAASCTSASSCRARGPGLARGGRAARGLHHRARRALHPGRPGPGDRLLVHGAAGGVGTAAVQLGRSCGAHGDRHRAQRGLRDAVAALGADAVLDPAEFTDHGPFDVVLELVGAPELGGDLKALATGGRIVVIGVGAGFKAEVNLLAMMGKRATLRASTLRAGPLEEKALTARAMERHVLPLFASGALRVPVAETFPLEQAVAAYDRFSAGGKLGKIVLLA
jgi:NADPH:quinone reductase-like Zn-dependent oxidoreductase